jgi:glutamine amidotransferase
MQLMTEGSEEGEMAGLAWIPAQTRRFSFSPGTKPLRVPHMGWNDVEFRPDSPMAANMPPNPRFYFVHSYHVTMANEDQMWMGRTVYGFRFVSGFSSGNIHGVQFHPEKSHKFGLQFLRNFASLT